MKSYSFLLAIFLTTLIACNSPKKYVKEALDIIQTNSVKKNQINWTNFRNEVYMIGRSDKTIEDAQSTIVYALMLLHDNHSSFITRQNFIKFYSDTSLKQIQSLNSNYDNGIGYLEVPGFKSNPKLGIAFATKIQNLIKELDKNEIKGWIIDIRYNTGGAIWPMLLGLGPILNDGITGYFVDANNNYTKWGYENGRVFTGNSTMMKIETPFYLRNKNKKIAILIGNSTASAGEAIAVAFKGCQNALLFGDNTFGTSTGNQGYFLRDSSLIILATAIFADRNKNLYGKSLIPDIIDRTDPRKKASEWINE
jgi:carboxyl-terminal processing protease